MEHSKSLNKKALSGFFFLIMLLFISSANSKTWFVSKTLKQDYSLANINNSVSSIEKAIKMAMNGDTIYVSIGLYDNDLKIINKSVVILGPQAGYLPKGLLNRSGGEGVILNSLNPYQSILISAAGVVIDGLKFGNGENNVVTGLYINAADVIISNCIFEGISQNGIYISGQGKNATISGNHIDATEFEGVLASAENVTITNNYISNNTEFSSISVSQKTKIQGNNIFNSPNFGIEVIGDQALLSFINDNKIENTAHQKIFIPNSVCLLSNENKLQIASIIQKSNRLLFNHSIVNSELFQNNSLSLIDNFKIKKQEFNNSSFQKTGILKMSKKDTPSSNFNMLENICNGL